MVAGTLALALVQREFRGDRYRWSSKSTILHFRIIFPHLSAVYEDLPTHVRERISRNAARRYDSSIVQPRIVMNAVTGRDPEQLVDLTDDLTRTVLQRRWPRLAASVLGDAVENLFVTVSFYARWTAWTLGGQDPRAFLSLSGAIATFGRLMTHHPPVSQLAVALGGIGFAYALVLAALALRSGGHLVCWPSRRQRWLAGAPVLAYAIANAALFTLLNLDLVRYFLLAQYRLALAWLVPGCGRSPQPTAEACQGTFGPSSPRR
jgi:hypothetical protein